MRPNFAQDAPPTVFTAGGADYPVNVDYRVWLDILQLWRDWLPDAETPEQIQHNVDLLEDIQVLAFGGILADVEPIETIKFIDTFLRGYPSAPMNGDGKQHRPTFSFNYDLNEIIIAIRNQSGIDLSYQRKEPFHWWLFLLEFHTLCGEHYILNLMDARGYEGEDPEMLKRRRMCALPVEQTAAEKALMDEINAEMGGIYAPNQH